MKVAGLLIVFLISTLTTPDLSELRKNYPKASNSEAITNALQNQLVDVTKEDEKILVAYKGAVSTLMAKYAKGIKNKKDFFKTGAELIEYAVEKEPENLEIRCIRLSVQENSPKIVGYKDNIPEDKQFLINNYKSASSTPVTTFIKNYVMGSALFDTAEKQLF
ncbi:hypothetical protein [uncultured Kriegella sp.]|uniref:hypothetical protein n=1 Tax=uncultured Kriegella sp. TaxID=1798910 RepID=UPI0030DB5800|tara:strand:+ start:88888 stop:89376 length:489 start_codon:yes stop_codon:yes gene_type:complete